MPTEEEWKWAARGGRENAVFPWGGYYVRNSDGQFLANFTRVPQILCKNKTEEGTVELATENTGVDNMDLWGFSSTGAFTLAQVDQYFPNDFGLYNMSGNAAEMLDQAGTTKGGSWASYGYYLRIDAEDEFAGFTEPSPKIGFRYFMEVIEE